MESTSISQTDATLLETISTTPLILEYTITTAVATSFLETISEMQVIMG